MIDPVTSTSNRRVKDAAALRRGKDRRQQGAFLVEGQHPVAEAIADGWVTHVFATEDDAPGYLDRAEVVVVDRRVLEHICDSKTPQGVVAVAQARTRNVDELVDPKLLVVLCGVADPGNLGTIIRTADALGADGVILTQGSVDPFNPKVVRSAAGSISHVPLVVGAELVSLTDELLARGVRLVGLDGSGGQSIEDDGVLEGPIALFLGSEAHGLPSTLIPRLTTVANVPMYGRAESLNVAAATSIALYSAVREARRER